MKPSDIQQKTKTKNKNKKKPQTNKQKNYRVVDFVVPTNHREKIKENEKRDKYLDLARELKSDGT